MTQKYNCHINNEHLYSIESVKYIYKYIRKGTDQATVKLSTTDDNDDKTAQIENDEILQYQNLRYVGPVEACSRIFEYSIYHRHPAVMKLDLHLENQHQVLFDPKQTKERLQEKLNKSKRSKLTEFFRTKREDESSKYKDIKYQDMPEHYTWDLRHKCWKKEDIILI